MSEDLCKDDLNIVNSGVEPEIIDENIVNEFPFNPNEINIQIIPRTIGQLVDMLEYDEIIIPNFQRSADLWKPYQKSRFIESLMLKLPIPLFYFAESENKNWIVIDGLQRISTLKQFILNGERNNQDPLVLNNLEFRKEYNGKTWRDLPHEMKRRINTNQITINLIGKETPKVVQYTIFSRINQASVTLTSQEIRTALFQGFQIDFLNELVSENTPSGLAFNRATDSSISDKRQENLDFASRFIAFYLKGYEAYSPDMEAFLLEGTKAIPNQRQQQQQILNEFLQAMCFAHDLFGGNAFRKPSYGVRRNPINKSLFEVMSVQFAHLTQEEKQKITNSKNQFITRFNDLFDRVLPSDASISDGYIEIPKQNNLDRDRFIAAISVGTAAPEKVKFRHERFKNLLLEFTK